VYPHDKHGIINMAKGHCNSPEGLPQQAEQVLRGNSAFGTALPKKKLDASRIVGYGVAAAQKPAGRVNF
jgi:hypothetical protein